jgi:hypothetical protein
VLSSRDQLMMQRVTKTAGFIDGMHGMASSNFFLYGRPIKPEDAFDV